MSKYIVVCKKNSNEFYDRAAGSVVFDDPSSAGLYLRWIFKHDLQDEYLCDDNIDKNVFDFYYIQDIVCNLLRRHRENIVKEFDVYKLVLMRYVCYFYFRNKKYVYKIIRIKE